MRVLVLWANDRSPNVGVRVLARGTEALAQRIWPDAEVTFHNYGDRAAPVRLGSLRALAKEAVTRKAGLAEWFREFDVVVDTRAGDSFTSIYGFRRLVTMGAVSEFARRAGVPVVLGPQTIGPFDTRLSRLVARRSLTAARSVMVRDRVSSNTAERLGRRVDVCTTDVVFALDVPVRTASRDVILNISGLLWQSDTHLDKHAYRATVKAVYDALVAEGRRVSLLAHVLDSPNVDNDVPALLAFHEDYAPEAEMVVPASLPEVREVLAGASILIGSRMHACLNALSVGTPAVALAYSRKFEPLFADIGWQHSVDLGSGVDSIVEAVLAATRSPDIVDEVVRANNRARELLEEAVDGLAHVAENLP